MSENMDGVGIVQHQDGEVYAYDESSIYGSRGYGPLHHTGVPTNPTEVLDILDNQTGQALEDMEADGNWLWDELEAGRATLVNYNLAAYDA
jgi:hypothetical protein